jgi:hypothetical protein
MIFSLLILLISASLDLQFLMSEMKTAKPRIPSPRTAGMMTQHKKFSSEIVTRHFKTHSSSKKNAVDRIPSPRTAGMLTQHKILF